ncbi:MAG: hypothetical protein LW853_06305 [Rickettsiales bacterium]|jgi:hypothetical protein|nr:hypothetical protein [Rickettsiales bacterium]
MARKTGQSERAVIGAAVELEGLQRRVKDAGADLSDELRQQAEAAKKAYKDAARKLEVSRGGLGASIREMFSNMANVFRKSGPKAGESVSDEALKLVDGKRAGIIERVAGKPFRIAANNPRLALGAAAAATVAGVGIWAKNRAERQTMESYQQAAAQMQAAQSYMNSVTPQEAAALEARLAVRSSASGHADKIAADRAAAAQAAAPVAG